LHLEIFFQSNVLVALSPLALAPVSLSTEVLTSATEVGSRAAKTSSALLVDNRTASLSSTRGTLGGSRLSRRLLVVALSVTSLAAVAAVESLVLDVVLGAAVAGGGAAAVEVAVGTGARAGYTALGVSTDVDLGNGGREGGGGRGGLLGCAGLHCCLGGLAR
jgi:hypothetical protein